MFYIGLHVGAQVCKGYRRSNTYTYYIQKTDKQNLMVDGEDLTVKPGKKQKKRKAEEEIKKEETVDDNEDMNEQREEKQKKQKKRKVEQKEEIKVEGETLEESATNKIKFDWKESIRKMLVKVNSFFLYNLHIHLKRGFITFYCKSRNHRRH